MLDNLAELILVVGAALLSLLFEFVPGFSGWYQKYDSQTKSLIMFIILLVATGGMFVFSCYSPYVSVECSETGLWELVGAFVLAIMSNQGVHRLTKGISLRKLIKR